jgi:hypothetical protein
LCISVFRYPLIVIRYPLIVISYQLSVISYQISLVDRTNISQVIDTKLDCLDFPSYRNG